VLEAIRAGASTTTAAVKECSDAMLLHAQVCEDSMKRIAAGVAERVPYEFTVKRDEQGFIKSVVARPTTLLGE
jgi:hypothetical protein